MKLTRRAAIGAGAASLTVGRSRAQAAPIRIGIASDTLIVNGDSIERPDTLASGMSVPYRRR